MSLVSRLSALAEAIGLDMKDKVGGNDPRLSDAREWTAATVTQAEAEAGIVTTARKWTAQRVRQAIAAWYLTISTTFTRTLLERSNAAQVRGDLGLGTAATGNAVHFAPLKSLRDFNSGTLIKTDIGRYRAWLLHITGNSYRLNEPPFQLTVQGYDYDVSSAYAGGDGFLMNVLV